MNYRHRIKNSDIFKYGSKVYHPIRDTNYRYNEETDTVYFERSNGTWKEMPNEEIRADIKYIKKHGVKKFRESKLSEDEKLEKALREAELKQKQKEQEDSYKMQHEAPCSEYGVRADDLIEAFSNDIYSSNAALYHGHGGEQNKKMDEKAINIIQLIKNNPLAEIQIYRAIPNNIDAEINSGDWVTITKEYAEGHGESVLDGDYKILESKVKVAELYTDGNSIHEWGYTRNEELYADEIVAQEAAGLNKDGSEIKKQPTFKIN